MKKYRFVGLNRDVWLPDDIVVEIAIVPSWRTNIRSNQIFSGQTSYTQHETANFAAGANATMHKNWLHGGAGGSYVGFNFVVDDHKIIQLTPLNEVTWHAGTPTGNKYSWGTELCVNAGIDHTKARRASAALAGGILAAMGWGVDKLLQHNVWWGKDCPYLLRRDGRWAKFVADVSTYRSQALNAAKGTTTPVGGLAVGESAEALVNLNVRVGSGTNYEITTTIPTGTKVQIIDGPRYANGYTWWDIKGEFGTGWAAEAGSDAVFLKEVAAPAPEPNPEPAIFDGTKDVTVNDIVMHASKREVTALEGLRQRKWASTDGPIVRDYVYGDKIAVLGWLEGEDVAGENRWWIISPDGGRVWVGGTIEKP